MTDPTFAVTASAGSLRADTGVDTGTLLRHAWTAEGIVADPVTNGAEVLHLSVAVCVLNDLYRESAAHGVVVDGVRVRVEGGFEPAWSSTGITYAVELTSSSPAQAQARLLAHVDEVAEIPRALRAGAAVARSV